MKIILGLIEVVVCMATIGWLMVNAAMVDNPNVSGQDLILSALFGWTIVGGLVALVVVGLWLDQKRDHRP